MENPYQTERERTFTSDFLNHWWLTDCKLLFCFLSLSFFHSVFFFCFVIMFSQKRQRKPRRLSTVYVLRFVSYLFLVFACALLPVLSFHCAIHQINVIIVVRFLSTLVHSFWLRPVNSEQRTLEREINQKRM